MNCSNCNVKKIISLAMPAAVLLSMVFGMNLSAEAMADECQRDEEQILIDQSCADKEHLYQTTTKTTKATKSANGKVVTTYTCMTCGYTYSKTTKTIYKPTIYTLSTSTYTYNGSAKKPSVTIKDSKGNKLKNGTDYTLSYPSGRKNVGKYTIKITFKGNYSGTATKTFTIKPKSTRISKLTAGGEKFTVKWKKQSTQTTGYQIQYSTDKNFKTNNKTVTVSSNKTTSKTISKLKAKTKYYVRIRTYKTVKVNGTNTKIYSSWSSASSVNTMTVYDEKSQAFIKDKRWKNNISWNADREPKLSSYVCWGCVAYTSDFCKYVYGCDSYHDAKSTFKSVSSIKAGDVLRLSGSKWKNHWIVVISRDGNKLYTAEGNVYNNRLGRTAVGDSYYTISGNKLKRSGVGTFSLTKGYHMY
ncbi:MAG: fibronectin type III domain-containing protein [Clostridium sp.]|nr:fibronectin type III domain-containing protein [Clostridium sp.]